MPDYDNMAANGGGQMPPPPGGGQMPPPPGGGQMPPPPGGEVSPDDVMGAAQDKAAAQAQAIAASAPEPEGGSYKIKDIKMVVTAFNGVVDAIGKGFTDMMEVEGPPPIPHMEWDGTGQPQDRAGSWEGQLPPEVYVPVAAIFEGVKELEGGKFKSLYMDPTTLTSGGALTKASGMMNRIAKNKKLIAAMIAPVEGQLGPTEPGPDDFAPPMEELPEDMMAAI